MCDALNASSHDRFAERFVEKVRAFQVGLGFNTNVTHGPLIHERAVQKVESHVRDAQDRGAKILIGGEKLPATGPAF